MEERGAGDELQGVTGTQLVPVTGLKDVIYSASSGAGSGFSCFFYFCLHVKTEDLL